MSLRAEVVVVEVKSRLAERDSDTARYLTESVDHRKQRKLVKLTELFMRSHYGRHWRQPVRIDVIGVVFSRDLRTVLSVQHLIAAVSSQ